MKIGNKANYECPKGGRGRFHCWKFGPDGLATCIRCKLVLSKRDSEDLRRSNERSEREMGFEKVLGGMRYE